MRIGLLFLLCVLACLPAHFVWAALTGTVVLVKMSGTTVGSLADVYQQDISDAAPRMLIDHKTLPAAFRGAIAGALPSADGHYLLLHESSGVTIRNPVTGASRVVLGGSYSLTAPEKVVEHFGGNIWLWARATGAVHQLDIALAPSQMLTPSLRWSPLAHTLQGVFQDKHTNKKLLGVFDPGSRRWRILRHMPNDSTPYWMPDGTAILSIERGENEKAAHFVLTELTGQSSLLFVYAQPFSTVAVSPDGRQFALLEQSGVLLLNDAGHMLHKLAVSIAPEYRQENPAYPAGDVIFSPQGERVAIWLVSDTGEPHVHHHEELWIGDVHTGAAQRLRQENVMVGHTPGGDAEHTLLGWTPDAQALLLVEVPGTLSGAATEWFKLQRYPAAPDAQPTTLFETGTNVIDMTFQSSNGPFYQNNAILSRFSFF